MGYFSNGTEGEMYQERWCSRCLHHKGCAVWLLHLLHNYDECNKPDSFLHTLIPCSEEGVGNEKCTMFVAGGNAEDWMSAPNSIPGPSLFEDQDNG